MISEWWLLSPKELEEDTSAQLAKQQAYYAAFYGSDVRGVLNDIRELCFTSGDIKLIEFYNVLRNNAGRTRLTEQAMIEAEAEAIEFVVDETIEEEEEGEL